MGKNKNPNLKNAQILAYYVNKIKAQTT